MPHAASNQNSKGYGNLSLAQGGPKFGRGKAKGRFNIAEHGALNIASLQEAPNPPEMVAEVGNSPVVSLISQGVKPHWPMPDL